MVIAVRDLASDADCSKGPRVVGCSVRDEHKASARTGAVNTRTAELLCLAG
jgi:hypothetical protein